MKNDKKIDSSDSEPADKHSNSLENSEEFLQIDTQNVTVSAKNKFYNYMKVLAIIFVVVIFVCIPCILLIPESQWLFITIIVSIATLFLISLAIRKIINLIIFFRRPKENIRKVVDIIKAVANIFSPYISNFRSANKKDKASCIFFFVVFLLSIISMIVGVTLANFFVNYQVIGFIFMGISGGLFIFFFVTLIIVSKKIK